MQNKLFRLILTSALFLTLVDLCSRIPANPTFGTLSFSALVSGLACWGAPRLLKKLKYDLSNAGLSHYDEPVQARSGTNARRPGHVSQAA